MSVPSRSASASCLGADDGPDEFGGAPDSVSYAWRGRTAIPGAGARPPVTIPVAMQRRLKLADERQGAATDFGIAQRRHHSHGDLQVQPHAAGSVAMDGDRTSFRHGADVASGDPGRASDP